MVRQSLRGLSHHHLSDSDDSQATSRTQLSPPDYHSTETVTLYRSSGLKYLTLLKGFKVNLMVAFPPVMEEIWDSFQSLSPQFDKDKFLDQQRLDKLLVYAANVPALKSPSGEGRLGDDVTEARHDLKAECRIYKRSLLSAFESIPLN